MKLENTGIEGALVDIKQLNHLMGLHAFIKGDHWDYERVTYDYRIDSQEKNVTYYVRIQAYAVEGDIDLGNAVVKVLTPLLGKHYYPHGIEYGKEENFSESLVERAHKLVVNVAKEVEKVKKQ
ncbi:YugN family protein [Ornithinibacillus sp. 4-3]|uniref:YugN family protein n=1 Tax=Ornithinibacillus sp. 4-3 TaxID=3231488 RepID=A0AB39HUA9_9BACI